MKEKPDPFKTALRIKPQDRLLPIHSPEDEVKRLASVFDFNKPRMVRDLITATSSRVRYANEEGKKYYTEVINELKKHKQ